MILSQESGGSALFLYTHCSPCTRVSIDNRLPVTAIMCRSPENPKRVRSGVDPYQVTGNFYRDEWEHFGLALMSFNAGFCITRSRLLSMAVARRLA